MTSNQQVLQRSPSQNPASVPDLLLRWYDANRRSLPWRRDNPDAYSVWLSEIMLQQTTVKAVIPYFMKFLSLWPDVKALAAAPTAEVMSAWAGLGYYSRARNLHACAKLVAETYQGHFPAAEADLRKLPGVGPYTAAAVSAIAFNRRAVVVDGNVERVVSRLFAVETALPAAKPEIYGLTESITPHSRCGDFAQSMMDLGASLCAPRNPQCLLCPLSKVCQANLFGDPQSFPRKAPKTMRPLRRGAVFYIARADGAILARTRPDKGLLGGMTELPGSAWSTTFAADTALETAPLNLSFLEAGSVSHVFTHFALELIVFVGHASADTPAPPSYRWVVPTQFETEAWPSIMRKVLEAGAAHER